MPQLSRTGVSLEEDLLKEFDRLIQKRGYANRSEAFPRPYSRCSSDRDHRLE